MSPQQAVLFGDALVPAQRPKPVRVPPPRKSVAATTPKPRPPVRSQGPGELHLVPNLPRQVKRIAVWVEQLPDGRLRFSQPKVAGWAAVVRNPPEAARALQQAFNEAMIVSYADWKHAGYDMPDAPLHRRHKPIARSGRRCDVYEVSQWVTSPDDPTIWISPKGLKYPEDRQVVQRVMRNRVAMGLPARPELQLPDREDAA